MKHSFNTFSNFLRKLINEDIIIVNDNSINVNHIIGLKTSSKFKYVLRLFESLIKQNIGPNRLIYITKKESKQNISQISELNKRIKTVEIEYEKEIYTILDVTYGYHIVIDIDDNSHSSNMIENVVKYLYKMKKESGINNKVYITKIPEFEIYVAPEFVKVYSGFSYKKYRNPYPVVQLLRGAEIIDIKFDWDLFKNYARNNKGFNNTLIREIIQYAPDKFQNDFKRSIMRILSELQLEMEIINRNTLNNLNLLNERIEEDLSIMINKLRDINKKYNSGIKKLSSLLKTKGGK